MTGLDAIYAVAAMTGSPDEDRWPREWKVVAFSTKGAGQNEEDRIRTLLSRCSAELLPFDRSRKLASFWLVLRYLLGRRPTLAVMEGTGIAGGMALILARWLGGVRYVVSSGDSVGPFVARKVAILGPAFALYERVLCRCSAGFIGWTPYLVGRALTFGAPRGMTAAGFAPFPLSESGAQLARQRIRGELKIDDHEIVFGIVGNLDWTGSVNYCYGKELVEGRLRATESAVKVIVVGAGSGLARLRRMAGDLDGKAIHFIGGVDGDQVASYLAAFDIASLPQSTDLVGSLRYTTKISEYLQARKPIVTGQTPVAYDLDRGFTWRIPGAAPWSKQYVEALADLMNRVTHAEVLAKRQQIAAKYSEFDVNLQVERVSRFVRDICATRPS